MTRITREPLIGCEAEVISSKNTSLVGLKGKIVDETKNTFKLLTKDQSFKTVMKKDNVFSMDGMRIDGSRIVKRIEDRIKR